MLRLALTPDSQSVEAIRPTGKWTGIAPTGKQVSPPGTAFLRIAASKIVHRSTGLEAPGNVPATAKGKKLIAVEVAAA